MDSIVGVRAFDILPGDSVSPYYQATIVYLVIWNGGASDIKIEYFWVDVISPTAITFNPTPLLIGILIGAGIGVGVCFLLMKKFGGD